MLGGGLPELGMLGGGLPELGMLWGGGGKIRCYNLITMQGVMVRRKK